MFKPHLKEVHQFFRDHLQPGDLCIDATCGNGQDTKLLSQLAKTVYAIDIQEDAIANAQAYVASPKVRWFQQSHEYFPSEIQPGSVALIAYNLGYLPGGNKEIVTQDVTTIRSLQSALPLLKPGGALSIVCYPGHPGGDIEEAAVIEFVRGLDRGKFLVTYTQWPNRKKHPTYIKILLGQA